MGKIRVKTLGIQEAEEKQKQEAKKRKEKKKTAKVPGLKGGERVVAVGPTEQELAKLDSVVIATPSKTNGKQPPTGSGIATSTRLRRTRSKNYFAVAKLIDRSKTYSLQEALDILPKTHLSKFDETVELHINTLEKGVTATVTLPHGSGKRIRVAIADDKIIENVAKGKIDFDVLLAEPVIMPKLARVAKILGPRGLMPNPKSRTITDNPKELAKKYEGGQITLKTEGKAAIMHVAVGKLSFASEKLEKNIQAVLDAVKMENIKNVTLKSTMSPGIRIQLD